MLFIAQTFHGGLWRGGFFVVDFYTISNYMECMPYVHFKKAHIHGKMYCFHVVQAAFQVVL